MRSQRPGVLISSSGINYYGDTGQAEVDENAPPGNDFLARVCREWESEAIRAEKLGLRVVRLRTGPVLGQGGFLAPMAFPFKLGLGAVLGSGRQYLSWIHIADMIGIIRHAVHVETVTGPVNACSPNPASNREFSRELAKSLGRPLFLRLPAPLVAMAAGELGRTVLLAGQRACADKILSSGFTFRFASLGPALRDIYRRS